MSFRHELHQVYVAYVNTQRAKRTDTKCSEYHHIETISDYHNSHETELSDHAYYEEILTSMSIRE